MALNFRHFLNKFPATKLPVTLSEEDARIYSAENDPLPHKLISEYILPDDPESDELTEYVPCFQIDGLKKFDAVVYWRAGLMNYQYVLMTFEKGGRMIDKKVLAGVFSDGKIISRSVARLDNDMSIQIMSGVTDNAEHRFQASESTTIELEILPDGKIIELA